MLYPLSSVSILILRHFGGYDSKYRGDLSQEKLSLRCCKLTIDGA